MEYLNELIREEHQASIDVYKAVLFLLKHPEEPLPDDIFEVLSNTYKCLTESVFFELEELGYTASAAALYNITGSLMLESMQYVSLAQHETGALQAHLAFEFYKGIADVYLLLHEAQF